MDALTNLIGKMLQHLTMTVGGKGLNNYGVTPDMQFESASCTQLKIGMLEKKFDVMYESFGAMEREYCTMFCASVICMLSFLPWLEPRMVTMYAEGGHVGQLPCTRNGYNVR